MRAVAALVLVALALAGCSDDAARSCAPGLPPDGDRVGHPQPLAAGPGEARAGRITAAAQLPATARGLARWSVGDYVLANDRVAMVIEDVGASDGYDPWGGRPVGIALVEHGALVAGADLGELFVMIGRSTVVTEAVTVAADGSAGGPAVIRARGRLAHLPFLDPLLAAILADGFRDVEAAIDYSLAPGAETVDITMHLSSPRLTDSTSGVILHGFMFTDRMQPVRPGAGYTTDLNGAPWAAFVDDRGASFVYQVASGPMGGTIARDGFLGVIEDPIAIAGCALTSRLHARVTIGGPGLDGALAARARAAGEPTRELRGTVAGRPPGVVARVHVTDAAGGLVTRAAIDDDGGFTVHVPAGAAVTITAVIAGDVTGSTEVAAGVTTAAIALPPFGAIEIDRVLDGDGAAIPARVEVLPVAGGPPPYFPPGAWHEDDNPPGLRHAMRFHDGTPTRQPLPAGAYHVVVARGFEYEVWERDVTVGAGETVTLAPRLEHVVDTTGVQCGDFHVHTIASADAEDDALYKVRAAMADGVEILVRSDHEWVDDFQPLIEARGWERWAMGIGSVELSTFETWGHFGVFPLVPDPAQPNQGAPRWQTWPTADALDGDVVTLGPRETLAAVRARPERPAIIVNHPMGAPNYFGYVGLDPATAMVARPDDWDEDFRLVEVFNHSGWRSDGGGIVAAWMALLNSGRVVFAVGSSDSHEIRTLPVGYPRTCVSVGSDDPRAIDGELVRDRLAAGHATISGGIFVEARVGTAGPGDTATTGATAMVDVRVQAPSWVRFDVVQLVVDGRVAAEIPVTDADADPLDPALRWHGRVPVDVAPAGSWVVVVAHGPYDLAPVNPGDLAFGMTNPIFLRR